MTSWEPIVSSEEWRDHLAAKFASDTDEQIDALPRSGWDLDAENLISGLSAPLAPQEPMGPQLPPGYGDVMGPPSYVPPPAPDPFGRTMGTPTFGETDDTRVGLPEPSAFGATLEAGSPQGEAILGKLSRTAAEQTPGGGLAQGFLGGTFQGPAMTSETPLENVLTMGAGALTPVTALGDVAASGARAIASRVPGGEDVPAWAKQVGVTGSTPFLGGLLTPDIAGPATIGMMTPGPGEIGDVLRGGAAPWRGSAARG